MAISEDQARGYDILMNMLLKFLFGAAIITAFFIILFHLLYVKTSIQAWTLGVLESILTGTMYAAVQHYFPAVKATAKKSRKPTL